LGVFACTSSRQQACARVICVGDLQHSWFDTTFGNLAIRGRGSFVRRGSKSIETIVGTTFSWCYSNNLDGSFAFFVESSNISTAGLSFCPNRNYSILHDFFSADGLLLLFGGGGVEMAGRGMMSRISEVECLIIMEWQCRSLFPSPACKSTLTFDTSGCRSGLILK
jgi:hypothetical protein